MSEGAIYKDGTYLENNPTWHEEDSSWKARQIAKILEKNNVKPETICEIGCGTGEILNSLSKKFGGDIEFSGYEISPQAFEICCKKQKDNLNFYLENFLTAEESGFDVVLAIDVFEHVADYLGFLRKLRSKGEYKVFHIPLDLSVQTVLRSSPILKERKRLGHLHYFTKETALATLEDTGYEIIDFFYTHGTLEIPDQGWKTRLLNFFRKLFSSINEDLAVRILGRSSLLILAK